MAIKINKGGPLGRYYYLHGNVEYGPIELMELLENISADSMVYVQGGSWKTASEYPELKRFFSSQQKVVEKVVERVVETQVPAEKSAKTNYTWAIWLILIVGSIGGYLLYQQQQARLVYQEELDLRQELAAEEDRLRAIEQQRLQDSILSASHAILDSARLLKLEVEYQANTRITAGVVQNLFIAMSSRQSDLSEYFTDTVAVFERYQTISKYDLSKAINAEKPQDPYLTEMFQSNDSTFAFSNLEGEFGCYTFSLNYRLFQRKSDTDSVIKNKMFDVLIKVTPEYKINYLELFQPSLKDFH